ncbi:MAG: alpha/beta hydrolase-fold protein, partial [Gemmatimonadota bacterium]|nr:alpha/beta hydrolase-fold protein [Gemmatimonadota bacterium]
MKRIVSVLLMLFCLERVQAQEPETYVLHQVVSNRDTLVYRRVIRFNVQEHLFHVQDYFENGRIQMDAFYSSFDKRVKEDYQCDYRSNTKEGPYTEWHRNGRKRFEGHFMRGRRSGASTAWYESGQKEAEENWLNGQLHGRVRYWSEQGGLQFESTFEHGMNQHRRNVSYQYLSYLPKGYEADSVRKWPLVIYLHGGSDRGTDLRKLYASGIPDQVYRGREFPFIMLAPQSPEHLRWSTDDWFENFFKEVTARYRIDTDRVYLTGPSLGGSGTWYIAARYPGMFAAIAPISGFTSHLDYIDNNIDKLIDVPVWAFHGKLDTVVPFEETERIVRLLEGKNRNLRFSAEPD